MLDPLPLDASPADAGRLCLGVLAPEVPPMLGGMAELARHLILNLGQHHAVRLFAPNDLARETPAAPTAGTRVSGRVGEAVDGQVVWAGRLGRRPWRDLASLRRAEAPSSTRDRVPIHAWLALNAGLAPLARQLERPVYLYVHGNDFLAPWIAGGPRWFERVRRPVVPRLRQALRRRAIANALPRVRRVFANSAGTAALFARQTRHPQDRITVVPPGVPDAFFPAPVPEAETARPWSPQSPRPLRLLTVTRLSRHTRRKNVDGVLDAIARLPATLRDRVRYDVVGGGDDLERLRQHAGRLGLEAQVRFHGVVDEAALRAAYREADLFIMASRATREDVEGFGIVYLEAAAAGTPSIASREGGAVEAIDPGRTGLVLERSTSEAIAAGLEGVLDGRHRFDPKTVRTWAEAHRWPAATDRLRAQLLADH